jgi:acyl dehydratase
MDRMREARGRWSDFGAPSFPISTSDIRRWAIAVYWPDPPPRQYWDEAYAASTRWGGIVAPPEFNPFAWPVPGRFTALEPRPDYALPGEPGQKMLNGGTRIRFGVPMRPGDVIRSRIRLRDWKEREGRLGLMLFSDSEREWVNQKGETVRTAIDTIIRYEPRRS